MTLEQKLTPQEEFEHHLQDWKEQTKDLYTREDCIKYDAYNKIIAMGEKAFPYIREVLKKIEKDFTINEEWFPWAQVVKTIAGPEFPIPEQWAWNPNSSVIYTKGWLDAKLSKRHPPAVHVHFEPDVPPEKQQKFLDYVKQILKEEGADDIPIYKKTN